MAYYNDWFNEVSEEEYNMFVKGLRLVKPNHVTFTVDNNGREWKLDGKLIAFWLCDDWGKVTYCITNEDIGV